MTGSLGLFGSAREIAFQIKDRTKTGVGLTCSVGVGYSMATAKLASEENKPDGYFEIPDAAFFKELVADRDVRIIMGVGVKSAEKLHNIGIKTVRDIWAHRESILMLFGKRGQQIVEVADGIDTRAVTPYYESEAKSLGREQTFQHDSTSFDYIKGYLIEFAKELSMKLRELELYAQTVTLKITYGNMKSITRSRSMEPINDAGPIYEEAAAMLDKIEKRPVRLVGISVSNFAKEIYHQLTLGEIGTKHVEDERKTKLNDKLFALQQKYGLDVIRTGFELEVEKRFEQEKQSDAENE